MKFTEENFKKTIEKYMGPNYSSIYKGYPEIVKACIIRMWLNDVTNKEDKLIIKKAYVQLFIDEGYMTWEK